MAKCYKSFEDMRVWQKSMDISVEIFKLTDPLPRKEDYGLTSQIRRSSNSVSANIAEGFGRTGNRGKTVFCANARGSAFETINHLIYGNNVGYFKNTVLEDLSLRLYEVVKELNRMMKSIHSQSGTEPFPQS